MKKGGGLIEVGTLDAILAQNKLLTWQMAELNKKFNSANVSAISHPPVVCDFCAGNHANVDFSDNIFSSFSSSWHEQVNYIGNPPRPQNNPYSQTYNLGWRNHPNFSWGNKNNKGTAHRPPFTPQVP